MKDLSNISCGYIMLTLVFVVFHVIRGAVGQTYLNPMVKDNKLKCWQNIIVFYLHDFILHLTCTVFGFICFYLAFMLAKEGLAQLSESASILFVSLSLIGLAGVTGQLAALLSSGKLPWLKG